MLCYGVMKSNPPQLMLMFIYLDEHPLTFFFVGNVALKLSPSGSHSAGSPPGGAASSLSASVMLLHKLMLYLLFLKTMPTSAGVSCCSWICQPHLPHCVSSVLHSCPCEAEVRRSSWSELFVLIWVQHVSLSLPHTKEAAMINVYQCLFIDQQVIHE